MEGWREFSDGFRRLRSDLPGGGEGDPLLSGQTAASSRAPPCQMDRLSWCLEQLSPPGFDAALAAARVILETRRSVEVAVGTGGEAARYTAAASLTPLRVSLLQSHALPAADSNASAVASELGALRAQVSDLAGLVRQLFDSNSRSSAAGRIADVASTHHEGRERGAPADETLRIEAVVAQAAPTPRPDNSCAPAGMHAGAVTGAGQLVLAGLSGGGAGRLLGSCQPLLSASDTPLTASGPPPSSPSPTLAAMMLTVDIASSAGCGGGGTEGNGEYDYDAEAGEGEGQPRHHESYGFAFGQQQIHTEGISDEATGSRRLSAPPDTGREGAAPGPEGDAQSVAHLRLDSPQPRHKRLRRIAALSAAVAPLGSPPVDRGMRIANRQLPGGGVDGHVVGSPDTEEATPQTGPALARAGRQRQQQQQGRTGRAKSGGGGGVLTRRSWAVVAAMEDAELTSLQQLFRGAGADAADGGAQGPSLSIASFTAASPPAKTAAAATIAFGDVSILCGDRASRHARQAKAPPGYEVPYAAPHAPAASSQSQRRRSMSAPRRRASRGPALRATPDAAALPPTVRRARSSDACSARASAFPCRVLHGPLQPPSPLPGDLREALLRRNPLLEPESAAPRPRNGAVGGAIPLPPAGPAHRRAYIPPLHASADANPELDAAAAAPHAPRGLPAVRRRLQQPGPRPAQCFQSPVLMPQQPALHSIPPRGVPAAAQNHSQTDFGARRDCGSSDDDSMGIGAAAAPGPSPAPAAPQHLVTRAGNQAESGWGGESMFARASSCDQAAAAPVAPAQPLQRGPAAFGFAEEALAEFPLVEADVPGESLLPPHQSTRLSTRGAPESAFIRANPPLAAVVPAPRAVAAASPAASAALAGSAGGNTSLFLNGAPPDVLRSHTLRTAGRRRPPAASRSSGMPPRPPSVAWDGGVSQEDRTGAAAPLAKQLSFGGGEDPGSGRSSAGVVVLKSPPLAYPAFASQGSVKGSAEQGPSPPSQRPRLRQLVRLRPGTTPRVGRGKVTGGTGVDGLLRAELPTVDVVLSIAAPALLLLSASTVPTASPPSQAPPPSKLSRLHRGNGAVRLRNAPSAAVGSRDERDPTPEESGSDDGARGTRPAMPPLTGTEALLADVEDDKHVRRVPRAKTRAAAQADAFAAAAALLVAAPAPPPAAMRHSRQSRAAPLVSLRDAVLPKLAAASLPPPPTRRSDPFESESVMRGLDDEPAVGSEGLQGSLPDRVAEAADSWMPSFSEDVPPAPARELGRGTALHKRAGAGTAAGMAAVSRKKLRGSAVPAQMTAPPIPLLVAAVRSNDAGATLAGQALPPAVAPPVDILPSGFVVVDGVPFRPRDATHVMGPGALGRIAARGIAASPHQQNLGAGLAHVPSLYASRSVALVTGGDATKPALGGAAPIPPIHRREVHRVSEQPDAVAQRAPERDASLSLASAPVPDEHSIPCGQSCSPADVGGAPAAETSVSEALPRSCSDPPEVPQAAVALAAPVTAASAVGASTLGHLPLAMLDDCDLAAAAALEEEEAAAAAAHTAALSAARAALPPPAALAGKGDGGGELEDLDDDDAALFQDVNPQHPPVAAVLLLPVRPQVASHASATPLIMPDAGALRSRAAAKNSSGSGLTPSGVGGSGGEVADGPAFPASQAPLAPSESASASNSHVALSDPAVSGPPGHPAAQLRVVGSVKPAITRGGASAASAAAPAVQVTRAAGDNRLAGIFVDDDDDGSF